MAILFALEATLLAGERALLAAHAELEEQDLAGEPSRLPARAVFADAMLTQMAALSAWISRYRAQSSNRGLRGGQF